MKKYIPHTIIVIIILLLLGGWFYWYQWRPSEARKYCYKVVLVKRDAVGSLSNNDANNYYRRCLTEKGIEAENLVK